MGIRFHKEVEIVLYLTDVTDGIARVAWACSKAVVLVYRMLITENDSMVKEM